MCFTGDDFSDGTYNAFGRLGCNVDGGVTITTKNMVEIARTVPTPTIMTKGSK